MSGLALGWARKRSAPSKESKPLLVFLADNANETFAWPGVETLAADLQCSARTVQRLLKQLVDARLLIRLDVEDRYTGRTRSCGYYFPVHGHGPSAKEIAWFEQMVGGRVTSVSPWEGDMGVTGEGDTHVTGRVTPVSPLEPLLEPSGSEEPSPGERERDALVMEIQAAMPATMGRVSSEPDYREALDVLAARGEDLSVLPGCLRRLAVCPLFKGLKVPPRLERWLIDGKWKYYLAQPELDLAPAAKPAPVGDPRLAELREAVRPFIEEAQLRSYVEPATLQVRDGVAWLVAATGTGHDWIKARCFGRMCNRWRALDAAEPLRLTTKSAFEAQARQENA